MSEFDLMAKEYDTQPRMDRAAAISAAIGERIENGAAKTAMEYGCGTGLVGLGLADRFRSLVLADSSRGMLAQAERKIAQTGAGNVTVLGCDLTKEAVPERFDYIFMSLVLHHIHETGKIIARLRDMLNEGGHLLIVDLDEDDGGFHANHPGFDGHHGFSQNELSELCREMGFKTVNTGTFYRAVKETGEGAADYSLFLLDAGR